MPSKKRKYEARFPPARIKKIMQTDEEIGKVAAAVPVIISRSLEIFLQSLVETTAKYTNERKAKTMTTSHLKHCIENEGKFDFLKDLVVNIADIANPEEEEGSELGEKPKKPRKPRQSSTEKKKKKKESSSEEESDIQSDGDESGSTQTSFPSSPNPLANIPPMTIPPIDIPPMEIPPINIPPITIPHINIPPINLPPIASMDPISKLSNMQNTDLHQGASSPRNVHISHGMPSPRSAQSPSVAHSPNGAPSPRGEHSPQGSPSPCGISSPMETVSSMVAVPPLNVPLPLVASPRNVPSPLYVSDVQTPQMSAASPLNPLVPQTPPPNIPMLMAHSPTPSQRLPSKATQSNAPVPQADVVFPKVASPRPPPVVSKLLPRPSHSIDAIMGNITSAPLQQQQRPQPKPSHTPSISSNFMPNFNLQGNGTSVPPISTSFRMNFPSPFQVTNEDEDDDYDT